MVEIQLNIHLFCYYFLDFQLEAKYSESNVKGGIHNRDESRPLSQENKENGEKVFTVDLWTDMIQCVVFNRSVNVLEKIQEQDHQQQ